MFAPRDTTRGTRNSGEEDSNTGDRDTTVNRHPNQTSARNAGASEERRERRLRYRPTARIIRREERRLQRSLDVGAPQIPRNISDHQPESTPQLPASRTEPEPVRPPPQRRNATRNDADEITPNIRAPQQINRPSISFPSRIPFQPTRPRSRLVPPPDDKTRGSK